MLRNTHAEDSGPLCWATPQRFPCLPSFRALTIYVPRLWPFSNLLRRPFHRTLPLPARVWPLSSLLCRTASRVLFFGRLQHCPFKQFQLRHSLIFGRLLSKPLCFLWRCICVRSLQSFSDIVFWERTVFYFVVLLLCVIIWSLNGSSRQFSISVVSPSACIYLIIFLPHL